MKKNERIQNLVDGLGQADPHLDPCYTGWFTCFNRGEYYEAHDVLEHLWLQTTGPNYAFFKGLIQLAGAFVHLQKQHARPWHVKDGARLRPAFRLFRLARGNLHPFMPQHMRLDVTAVCSLCDEHIRELESSAFQQNPWVPERLPVIELQGAVRGSSDE